MGAGLLLALLFLFRDPILNSVVKSQLLAQMPDVELVLLVGAYAQAHYLGKCKENLTQRVQRWRDFLPRYLPLPHPSPRNNLWLRRNPWFEEELVPALRKQIADLLL